jgi:cation diffusion facilitator family transporter
VAQSTIVIMAAAGANLAIAAAKVAAWVFTGSSAMLTEGIHSLVDTGDQALLLFGEKRGEKPPDASHPFGYGLEVYFWSFVVALMIFALGGAVSIYEGIHKLQNPSPITKPWVNFLVLGVSVLLEGASLVVAFKAFNKTRRPGRRILSSLRRSKDPAIFTVLLEDSAALAGLTIALAGVPGASVFGLIWADGAASIAIGVLLVGVAAFLAYETRSLLTGEAASEDLVRRIRGRLESHPQVASVADVLTLQLGPKHILVVLCLNLKPATEVTASATQVIDAVKQCDPRIGRVFLSPPQTPFGDGLADRPTPQP